MGKEFEKNFKIRKQFLNNTFYKKKKIHWQSQNSAGLTAKSCHHKHSEGGLHCSEPLTIKPCFGYFQTFPNFPNVSLMTQNS